MTTPTNTFPAIGFDYSGVVPSDDLPALVGLLNSTPAVQALLGDYLDQNVLTYRLYQNRITTLNGVAAIQGLMPQVGAAVSGDTPFGTVAPGAAFPLVEVGQSDPTMVQAVKIAGKAIVAYEDLLAFKRNAIDTGARQLSNTYSDAADAISVAALTAAISTTTRAVASGSTLASATLSSQVTGPVALARTVLKNARLGLKANAYVLSESNFSQLYTIDRVAEILAFSENESALTSENPLPVLNGLEVITIPDELCVGNAFATAGLVTDLSALGALVEQIPLRAESVWNGANLSPAEAWVISLAHNFTPAITNPLAGCWVTGLD